MTNNDKAKGRGAPKTAPAARDAAVAAPGKAVEREDDDNRRVVAVTTSARANGVAWRCAAALLRRAGAAPFRLRVGAADSRAWDALVVLGGSDVDPLLYGGLTDEHRRLDRERDTFELAQLRLALDRGRPILGICRGAQLLNIVHGGSLARFQPARRRTALPRRRVEIAADTVLSGALGKATWVNSLHEYAVDEVGTGMIVSARDGGGLVQAIELAPTEQSADRFAVGVQWHPELMPYLRDSRRLFAALVAAANAG